MFTRKELQEHRNLPICALINIMCLVQLKFEKFLWPVFLTIVVLMLLFKAGSLRIVCFLQVAVMYGVLYGRYITIYNGDFWSYIGCRDIENVDLAGGKPVYNILIHQKQKFHTEEHGEEAFESFEQETVCNASVKQVAVENCDESIEVDCNQCNNNAVIINDKIKKSSINVETETDEKISLSFEENTATLPLNSEDKHNKDVLYDDNINIESLNCDKINTEKSPNISEVNIPIKTIALDITNDITDNKAVKVHESSPPDAMSNPEEDDPHNQSTPQPRKINEILVNRQKPLLTFPLEFIRRTEAIVYGKKHHFIYILFNKIDVEFLKHFETNNGTYDIELQDEDGKFIINIGKKWEIFGRGHKYQFVELMINMFHAHIIGFLNGTAKRYYGNDVEIREYKFRDLYNAWSFERGFLTKRQMPGNLCAVMMLAENSSGRVKLLESREGKKEFYNVQ